MAEVKVVHWRSPGFACVEGSSSSRDGPIDQLPAHTQPARQAPHFPHGGGDAHGDGHGAHAEAECRAACSAAVLLKIDRAPSLLE